MVIQIMKEIRRLRTHAIEKIIEERTLKYAKIINCKVVIKKRKKSKEKETNNLLEKFKS
jgi:hypothetical protein